MNAQLWREKLLSLPLGSAGADDTLADACLELIGEIARLEREIGVLRDQISRLNEHTGL